MQSSKTDEKDEKSSLNSIFSHFTFFSVFHHSTRYQRLNTAQELLHLYGTVCSDEKKLQSRYRQLKHKQKPTKSVQRTK